YHGQGMKLTIDVSPEDFAKSGLSDVAARFDAEHEQLFTFALDAAHELVGLRAVVQGAKKAFINADAAREGGDAAAARTEATKIFADGEWRDGHIYDRARLAPGARVEGPAVVTEMDSTSVILPGHVAVVDEVGNLLIWPADHPNAS
ncbi:MAG: hydantoinase/oxoprolinase family protein, partial [Pseudomonadota bacterium]